MKTLQSLISFNSLDSLYKSEKFHITFLVSFAAVLFFAKTGNVGLSNYDDCYYAQKAKEILATGDWFTMHFDGKPKFDNPPLYMWLTAASFLIFGVNDFAARFPCQLMGVLSIIALYFLVKLLFPANCHTEQKKTGAQINKTADVNWIALFSSVILCTSYMFIRYARHAMVDTTLVFFTILSFLFLHLALNKNPRWFLGWGFAISACILTKSVLGLFPLCIAVLYLSLSGEWKKCLHVSTLLALCVIIFIGCSWYLYEYLNFGNEFLADHFGWLIFSRGLVQTESGDYSPLFYLKDLLTFFWPWLPVFLFGLFLQSKLFIQNKSKSSLLILLWFLFVFVVMSFMKTQSKWYVLPAYPAIAIISAYSLNSLLQKKNLQLLFVQLGVPLCLVLSGVLLLSPLKIDKARELELRELVPTIKELKTSSKLKTESEAIKLIGYKFDFYDVNNALLWYSGYSTSQILNSFKELSTYLQKNEDKKIATLMYSNTFEASKLEFQQLKNKYKVLETNKKFTLLQFN